LQLSARGQFETFSASRMTVAAWLRAGRQLNSMLWRRKVFEGEAVK
jgi:hypothetical protein